MTKPTFSREVRNAVLIKQGWKCCQCDEYRGLTFHHIIINSKLNQRLYGELLQTRDNCRAVCSTHHQNRTWDIPIKRELQMKFKFELMKENKWRGKT